MAVGQRGRYEKGKRRREDILDSALEVFAARGNASMSMRAVSQELGVSHAAVQHYFDSLEELLLEVVERRDARNRLASASEDVDTLSEQLVVGVRENASTHGLTALYTSMLATAVEPNNEVAKAHFAQRFSEGRAELVEAIEAGRAAGVTPAGPGAEAIASLIMAAFDGIQIQWLLDPTIDMRSVLEVLSPLLGAARPTPVHESDSKTPASESGQAPA